MWTYGLAWFSGIAIGVPIGAILVYFLSGASRKNDVSKNDVNDWHINEEDIRKDLTYKSPRAIVMGGREKA